MNLRAFLMLPVLVGLGGAVTAAPAPVYAPGPAYAPGPTWQRPVMPQRPSFEAPAAVVRTGMERLIEVLNQKPRPTGLKLAAFLEQEIAPKFDFGYMAQMASGPAYQRMTETQRADLAQRMEQDFLEAMAGRLVGYESQQVRYLRPRPGPMGSAVVAVAVQNPGTYPSRLDFRLYKSGEDWKVYDVSANGNSLVNFYRQRFARAWSAPQTMR